MVLGSVTSVQARVKYYRSNSNMPFVTMMLNMMVVMGILDKIPGEYAGGYGGMPGWSPYGYRRANPGWRNYRTGRYSSYPGWRSGAYRGRYPGYNSPYYSPYSSYRNPLALYPGVSPYRSPIKNRPDIQKAYRDYNRSWLPMSPATCKDEPCDFDQSELTGLWVTDEGEMLGIRNEQFLWTDGVDAYVTGLMDISPGYVVANVDESDQQIVYQYQLEGDHLITRDRGGEIRHFWRKLDQQPLP